MSQEVADVEAPAKAAPAVKVPLDRKKMRAAKAAKMRLATAKAELSKAAQDAGVTEDEIEETAPTTLEYADAKRVGCTCGMRLARKRGKRLFHCERYFIGTQTKVCNKNLEPDQTRVDEKGKVVKDEDGKPIVDTLIYVAEKAPPPYVVEIDAINEDDADLDK